MISINPNNHHSFELQEDTGTYQAELGRQDSIPIWRSVGSDRNQRERSK